MSGEFISSSKLGYVGDKVRVVVSDDASNELIRVCN